MNSPWLSLLHQKPSSYFLLSDWGARNMRECFWTLNSCLDETTKKERISNYNFTFLTACMLLAIKKFPPQRNRVTFHFYFPLLFQQSEKNDMRKRNSRIQNKFNCEISCKEDNWKDCERNWERDWEKQPAKMMLMTTPTTTAARENSQQRTHCWAAVYSFFYFVAYIFFSLLK